jgi:hypothetical protein
MVVPGLDPGINPTNQKYTQINVRALCGMNKNKKIGM